MFSTRGLACDFGWWWCAARRTALPCDAPLVRRLRKLTLWRGRAAQTRDDGSPPPFAAAEGIGHQTLEAVALVVRRRSIHKCSGVSAAQPDGDFLDLNAADSKYSSVGK